MKETLEAVEQEEKLCEVATVRKSTHLCERVNAGGGCESVVTARGFGWANFE